MKKVLSVIAIAAVSAVFVACGPSKEEQEAAAKRVADSIATADSIANAQAAEELKKQAEADSIAKAAAQMAADSARIADSIAAAGKGKKK